MQYVEFPFPHSAKETQAPGKKKTETACFSDTQPQTVAHPTGGQGDLGRLTLFLSSHKNDFYLRTPSNNE